MRLIEVRKFVKKNYIALIGIFIGLLGLVSSFYFYQFTKREREPYFIVEPIRAKIIDYKKLSETQLRVVRLDSSEILGNISSVQFYFWNNGKTSIKKSNILEPLIISLDDDKGEIIDYRILKVTRNVVNPKINRDSANPKQNLILSFDILEKNDGMTCQLIYKGDQNIKLTILGTIEGVKKFRTDYSTIKKSRGRISFFVGLPLFILALLLVNFIFGKVADVIAKLKMKKITSILVFIVIMIFFLSTFGYIFHIHAKITSFYKSQIIPKSIMP